MKEKPRLASEYSPEDIARVKALALSIFRVLGDLAEDITIVGGFVPYLLIPQEGLGADDGHVGTADLDLVLELALLDEERYKEISSSLRRSGFRAAVKESGAKRLQQWVIPVDGVEVLVEFLIPPTSKEERPGRIHHLESDFGALVIKGAHLAFEDRVQVELQGKNLKGQASVRRVWVCGPAALLVLKAFAVELRDEPKDAYDVFYTLRHYPGGLDAILERARLVLDDPVTLEALGILTANFETLDHTGPMDVAAFLGDAENEDLRRDVSRLVRDFVARCKKEQGE